jgi:hypothetical protein
MGHSFRWEKTIPERKPGPPERRVESNEQVFYREKDEEKGSIAVKIRKEEMNMVKKRLRRSLIRFFAVLLVMAAWQVGPVPSASAGPAEDSAQMGDLWIKAFLEGNVEVMGSLYARDASFYAFLSPFRVEGREAIRATFAGLFKAFPMRAIVKRHFYVQVYDTTVVRSYYFTMTLGDAKGNVKSYHGRANIVYMVLEGQRVIVTHHASLLP